MQERHLGSTGLTTSAIGVGCMGFSQGYGPADDDESMLAIGRAVELGVIMLDTAMSYGEGHNERLVRRSLDRLPSDLASSVRLATKFGIVRDGSGIHLDGRPDRVQSYCDASLSRLGVEVIDLYYLHRVDPAVPVEETIGAMAALVAAGKVRHLGVSEVTPDQLEAAARVHPIAAVQFEWSLLWRRPELDLIPTARHLGVGLVPYSPLGRGLLTATLDRQTVGSSDFRRSDPRFQDINLTRNLAQVHALQTHARSLGLTATQLALAWLLAQGADVVPIPGTRKLDHMAENIMAGDIHLPANDLARLDEVVRPAYWVGDRRSFAAPSTARSPA